MANSHHITHLEERWRRGCRCFNFKRNSTSPHWLAVGR